MNFEKPAIAATLTVALLSGCSGPAPHTVERPTHSATTESPAPLSFDSDPDSGLVATFNVLDCKDDPNSWAVLIDSQPDEAKLAPDQEQTIGVPKDPYAKHRRFIAGVTFRSLGRDTYEFATAEDPAGHSTIVNLSKKSLARVMRGEEGYDIALTARLGSDGWAYVMLNCLPDFDFHGNTTPEPLLPDPLPPQITASVVPYRQDFLS